MKNKRVRTKYRLSSSLNWFLYTESALMFARLHESVHKLHIFITKCKEVKSGCRRLHSTVYVWCAFHSCLFFMSTLPQQRRVNGVCSADMLLCPPISREIWTLGSSLPSVSLIANEAATSASSHSQLDDHTFTSW